MSWLILNSDTIKVTVISILNVTGALKTYWRQRNPSQVHGGQLTKSTLFFLALFACIWPHLGIIACMLNLLRGYRIKDSIDCSKCFDTQITVAFAFLIKVACPPAGLIDHLTIKAYVLLNKYFQLLPTYSTYLWMNLLELKSYKLKGHELMFYELDLPLDIAQLIRWI